MIETGTTYQEGELIQQTRDAAVDYGEYFAIYQLGRGQYDIASKRVDALNELALSHPRFADRIRLLDINIERAIGLKKEFSTAPLTRDDSYEREGSAEKYLKKAKIEPEGSMERDAYLHFYQESRKPRTRIMGVGVPPDYTFSEVRHPIARGLLDLLNIANSIEGNTDNDPQSRTEKLKTNGKAMLEALGRTPETISRIKSIEVITAVLEGKIPIAENTEPNSRDLDSTQPQAS